MSDLELVQACIGKKRSAERLFFERFAGFTRALCRRYAKDSMEAEDMHQIGFIKCFQNLNGFSNKGPLGGWVRRIFVHSCLDEIKKRRRISHWISPIEGELIEEKGTENQFILEADAGELILLISLLPEGSRSVFNLHAVEGMNHAEVGEILGISESTSRVQLSRARAFLKNHLSEKRKLISTILQ